MMMMMMMINLSLLLFPVLFSPFLPGSSPLAAADPVNNKRASPTVVIPSPDATFVGATIGLAESFQGIPFAKPPVGQLRLNQPQPLDPDQSLGVVPALTRAAACPQNLFDTNITHGLPQAALGLLLQTPLFQNPGVIHEDCLYLNVYRPAGVSADEKLPVLFWMHGGGFQMGFTMEQEGNSFVADSVSQGKPIIFVAATYRNGFFGFLGGREVAEAGVGNLGLHDQRQAMRWVADNIAAFGGDPDKVTIWGESAGSISVFDHLVAFDGDNTYNGKPLFRAGIMNSGSVIPTDPLDAAKAQVVYDHVAGLTGCSSSPDSLQCLRDCDYDELLAAATTVPAFTGYQSIALQWMPRPDGSILTDSPDRLVSAGKFAKVPVIIGDEEDEGTLWSLVQLNLTTPAEVADYLQTFWFHHATTQDMDEFVATYQTLTDDGSPFRTGLLNNWYPQYKRLAAILGDLAFTLSRRYFLELRHAWDAELPAWSYMNSYFYGTPIIGSVHGGDILHVVAGVPYNYATRTIRGYYLSFIHGLDPNADNDSPEWPQYFENREQLWMFADSQSRIKDDYRGDSYEWITGHIPELTM